MMENALSRVLFCFFREGVVCIFARQALIKSKFGCHRFSLPHGRSLPVQCEAAVGGDYYYIGPLRAGGLPPNLKVNGEWGCTPTPKISPPPKLQIPHGSLALGNHTDRYISPMRIQNFRARWGFLYPPKIFEVKKRLKKGDIFWLSARALCALSLSFEQRHVHRSWQLASGLTD
jgi:hypothetical protein